MQAVKKVNEHRSFVRDKIMSCCAAFAIILLRTNAQPEGRICWFQKKTRAGGECRGLMRRLDDATARFVGGNLNCRTCSRHLMRATREANAFCSCPLQQHSSELSRRKIPKRLNRLFDRIGTNIHQLPSRSTLVQQVRDNRGYCFLARTRLESSPKSTLCFTLFTFYFSSK